MVQSKNNLRDVDLFQAQFFGYKPLGFIGFFMTMKMLYKHNEKMFSMQREGEKRKFESMVHRNKRKRDRSIKNVLKFKANA